MRDAGREADTTRLLQAGDTTRRCRYRKLMGRDIRSAALHYIPDGHHIAALGVLKRNRRELTLAHAVGDHVGVRRLEVPVPALLATRQPAARARIRVFKADRIVRVADGWQRLDGAAGGVRVDGRFYHDEILCERLGAGGGPHGRRLVDAPPAPSTARPPRQRHSAPGCPAGAAARRDSCRSSRPASRRRRSSYEEVVSGDTRARTPRGRRLKLLQGAPHGARSCPARKVCEKYHRAHDSTSSETAAPPPSSTLRRPHRPPTTGPPWPPASASACARRTRHAYQSSRAARRV